MEQRLDWFPCFPSKLLNALAGMSPDEGYVYWIVCLRIYETGKPFRDTIEALSRRTGIPKRRVDVALELSFSAGRLMKTEAGIRNPFADEVLADQSARRERRKSAGKEGAGKRWQKDQSKQRKEDSKATPDPMPLDAQLQVQLQVQVQDNPSPNGEGLGPATGKAGKVSDWPVDYRERFWERYPRKTEKKAAMAKLDALKKSANLPWQTFWSGVERYAGHVAGTEERYVKHPTTWLNKGCWDDQNQPNGGLNGNGHHQTDARRSSADRETDLLTAMARGAVGALERGRTAPR